MKRFLCAIFSLFIPGIGHMFLNRWKWGIFWLLTAMLTCGAANLLAACHVLFVEDERAR
jgi:TM2 domain-containing membrane protein YozV